MEKNWSYTIQEGPHKGKTLWSGRYVAVLGIVLVTRGNKTYALINKRGKGTPNAQGKYNFTCGFLDNEFGKEGVRREIIEECGYDIDSQLFKLYGVSTDPSDPNVSIRYIAHLNDYPKKVKAIGGEENEVDDVRWIELKDYTKYDWAFNHRKLAHDLYVKYGKGNNGLDESIKK